MTIREIKAKSIYRGCSHNCSYCDGRSEGYYVDGEFGEDVTVKVNAIEILNRELNPKRKRTPFKRSYMMPGGGVGDSYQPIEKKYQLTRKVLQLLYGYNLPVHVLTKSTLIQRDIDILKRINEKNRAIVSFSFSSVDDDLSAIFEPGVPSPSERLKMLAVFKHESIACGMFLLPVIPFITDTLELIEAAVRKASNIGVDFIIFGGMTLKEGKQKDYFFAYSISQLKEPLSAMKGDLRKIKGVGRTTEVIIREILETGSSAYYKKTKEVLILSARDMARKERRQYDKK